MNEENSLISPATPRRARGDGSILQKRYKDKRTGETKRTVTLYMKFYVNGKPRTESTGTTKLGEAKKALRRRLGEISSGRYIPADVEKTTFGQIKDMALNHYRANGRKSLDRLEDAVTHLNLFFTDYARVRDISVDRITAYMAARRDEKAANATINRELSALKLMLRLGERAGKVVNRPYVGMLEENNVKKGFFEEDQFNAVLAFLPEDLKPVFAVDYITGWRVKSELLTRQKSHLDLKAGWLRLEPGETKNKKGRMFPLVPRLRAILEAQAERTRQVEQVTGRIIPWLFHRNGKPIKSFRRAWRTACKKAGVPTRTPHDFRRTAVRNLERSGVPRSSAMAMVGHQTEAIYRRYAIVEETMLNEAGVEAPELLRHT
jgi:integrase